MVTVPHVLEAFIGGERVSDLHPAVTLYRLRHIGVQDVTEMTVTHGVPPRSPALPQALF